MTGKMKAAVLNKPHEFEVKMIDIPQIGPRDVLLKVKKAGVCGSDLPIYKAGFFVPRFPCIIGHEYSAVVAEKGAEVPEDVKIGDRVTGFNAMFCGECFWCKRGEYGLCPVATNEGLGFGTQGCFAEYVPVYNAAYGFNLFKIPDSLDDYEGATLEPMAVGCGNVAAAGVKEGDKVVVIGAGMVGISHYVPAKSAGATVVVIDQSDSRLALAKELGADYIFNSKTQGDPVEFIIDLWGEGRIHWTPGTRVSGMADIVFECVGMPEPFTQAFKMVRAGGTVLIAGTAKGEAPVDPRNISLKQTKVMHGLNSNIMASIELLGSGKFSTKPLMSHKFKLDDIEEAFETAMTPDKSIKVMIDIAD